MCAGRVALPPKSSPNVAFQWELWRDLTLTSGGDPKQKKTDDFTARSSDELSLAKGDRVQLLERDDEFGDGWFLGKHMLNGNSGLFPEGMSCLPCCRLPTLPTQ